MCDHEREEYEARIHGLEDDIDVKINEIRRLHSVCREMEAYSRHLEAQLESKTIWVVIKSADQSSFVDYESADPAEPDRQIMGVFSSEKSALELQEKLIRNYAEDFICFDADEVCFTVEEMTLQ